MFAISRKKLLSTVWAGRCEEGYENRIRSLSEISDHEEDRPEVKSEKVEVKSQASRNISILLASHFF